MFREIDNGRRRPKWILYGVLSFGHSDGDGDSCPVENPEWYARSRVCLIASACLCGTCVLFALVACACGWLCLGIEAHFSDMD